MVRDNRENYEEKALTCIHPSYTLSDTQDENASEVDRLMIKHFLNTLAEVAMTVASRNGEVKR